MILTEPPKKKEIKHSWEFMKSAKILDRPTMKM